MEHGSLKKKIVRIREGERERRGDRNKENERERERVREIDKEEIIKSTNPSKDS